MAFYHFCQITTTLNLECSLNAEQASSSFRLNKFYTKNYEILCICFSPAHRKTTRGVILKVVKYSGTGTGSYVGRRRIGALGTSSGRAG